MDSDFRNTNIQNSGNQPLQPPVPATVTTTTPAPGSPTLPPAAQPIIIKDRADKPLIKTGDSGPGGLHELFSTVGILATALVVALLMISFVFRSYQVDGPSMQNTLQNADKLIIWKVPRTWAKITRHTYIPKRGDIIVFTESGLSQYGQEDSKQLIKRVIGLPGDRVTITSGHYEVYNPAHPQGFDPDKTLGYGNNFPETSGEGTDRTIGADELFVSGDNRPNSLDSRSFGPIKAGQVIGKLALRVFPINQAKAF